MAVVYSHRFIAQQGLAGTGGSVTCPAGVVYVVKQITMYASVLGTVAAFFEDDASGAALMSARFNASQGGSEYFYGALVFGPGEGFHFQVNATLTDTVDVYAGGYILQSP
jgi:hypothetical protein